MRSESEVEDYLVARVKELGGEVRKVKWVGRDGAPDRLVMLPNQVNRVFDPEYPGHTVWVELKAEGRKATFPCTPRERKQHREHERMRKMGQRVEVVDSYAGVDEILG